MDAELFHKGTRRLIDGWSDLAGGGVPRRRDFDPMAVSDLLPQAFMLGRSLEDLDVRLAGELLYDLHGRSLRGESFVRLFAPPSRMAVQRSALQAVREGAPVVLKVLARNAEQRNLALEILLAPLVGPDGVTDRLLGLYQPTSRVAALHGEPIVDMTLHAALPVLEEPRRPQLTLAALNGRLIA